MKVIRKIKVQKEAAEGKNNIDSEEENDDCNLI